jgi:hypothetical protein
MFDLIFNVKYIFFKVPPCLYSKVGLYFEKYQIRSDVCTFCNVKTTYYSVKNNLMLIF